MSWIRLVRLGSQYFRESGTDELDKISKVGESILQREWDRLLEINNSI